MGEYAMPMGGRLPNISSYPFSDMFASYTSLEKKLLFPILGIVWIVVKLYQRFGSKIIRSKQTKIKPIRTWIVAIGSNGLEITLSNLMLWDCWQMNQVTRIRKVHEWKGKLVNLGTGPKEGGPQLGYGDIIVFQKKPGNNSQLWKIACFVVACRKWLE